MLMHEKRLKFIKKSNLLRLFSTCNALLVTLPKGNIV